LRATALVHEAYLRLAGASGVWQSRQAFCAAVAHAMRRILVDHARSRRRQKRGCGIAPMTLDEATWLTQESPPDLVDLDEVLDRLAQIDSRKSRIIELLFFAGLTYDECAAAINLSPATLYRELRLAKAWLCHELSRVPSRRIET
jgi:RNA polymerase sigma factor (TIGR02999 family)